MSAFNSTLTHARLLECVSYDSETGVFTAILKRSGIRFGKLLGNIRFDGYRRIGIDYTNHLAHRLAWLYVHGEWPEHYIDHIDGDPLNNRISNLRSVNQTINLQNLRKAHKNSVSKLLGVSFHARDNLWRARIRINGKDVCIGYFKDPAIAHQAYLTAKRQFHDGCTI